MWIPLIDNKRFPVRCIIRRPVQGGGITFVFDRAGRVIKKDGQEFWRLKKNKRARLKPTTFSHMIPGFMNKAIHVDLYNPNKDDYFPCKFNNGDVKVMSEDQRQWYISMQKWRNQMFKKDTDKWTKYLPIITVMFLGVAFMLIFIGAGQFMEGAAGSAGALNAAAQSLNDAVSKLLAAGQGGGLIKPPG